MSVILALTVLAAVAGSVALAMATRDFERGTTFHSSTGVAVYVGWFCHATAFVAALLLDPYRAAAAPVLAAVVGSALIVAGVGLFVLGLQRFQSFGQVTGTEVGELVTSGAYRFSRNPQYTGWIFLLTGAAITARSPLALGLALSVVVAMRIWIPHEERHLEEEFGEDYLRYRAQVPRFLRLNPGKQTTR